MKSPWIGSFILFVASVLISFGQASTGLEAEQTAEKFISPKVKGHLIWARSDNSTSTSPSTWSFLYFDPFAQNNGRLVQISNGAVLKIGEGLVELDKARIVSYKGDEVIPLSQIRIDSNKALEIVKDAAHLSSVLLTRVDYVLKADENNNVPSWRLVLFGAKGKDSEAQFGTARISALTGQIFSLDVKPDQL